MPTLSPRVRAALIVAATAALYVLAARFRVSVAFTNGTLALVSPPSGITVSAVLLWGPIALPGVVIGAVITYLSHGWPVTLSALAVDCLLFCISSLAWARISTSLKPLRRNSSTARSNSRPA